MREAARAIIIDHDSVLLVRRTKKDRDVYWVFPGGGLEPEDGGDPRVALARECLEELGVQAEIGIYFTESTDVMGDLIQHNRYYFARILNGEIGTGTGPEFTDGKEDRGAYAFEWVQAGDLAAKNVFPQKVRDEVARFLLAPSRI